MNEELYRLLADYLRKHGCVVAYTTAGIRISLQR